MIQNSFFIFRTDLSNFSNWKQNIKDLRAIWYDGDSDTIEGLVDVLTPRVLIVQEDLVEKIISKTGYKGKVIKSNNLPKKRDFNDSFESKSLAIFPSNDTHVYLMRKIITELKKEIACTIYSPALKNENAQKVLEEFKLAYHPLAPFENIASQHDGLFLANDWGVEEQFVSRQFQSLGKPVICIQESVIHFGDYQRRMEWCDFPFIQGIYTVKNLNRELLFLTGNPRYENLTLSDRSITDRVVINCNFTYGIYESIRMQWLEDIASVLDEAHLDYCIAQHPRDTGHLEAYSTIRSSAETIHDILRTSSMLITRFSSLIHESLALGRPVIYYNPHNENMYHDFAVDGVNLFLARSRNELNDAVETLKANKRTSDKEKSLLKKYGMAQYGSSDGLASERVLQALKIALTSNYQPYYQSKSKFKLMYQYQKARWKKNE